VVQFADAVNERTNGQVEIEIFPTGTLLKGREILEGIRKEIVDMAPVASFYYPGDFPFAGDAGMMPFGWTAKEAPEIVEAMRPIYGSELALHNARVLFFTPINTDWFTSKRVDPNDPDFTGMSFRSIGATYDKVIETLGGTPASMPSGEIAMAIRTGVVDGFTTSYQSYNGFDLWNDAPYIYDTGAGFLAMSVAWAITDEAWDSLPPDVQQIFIEESKNAEAWILEKSAGLDEEVRVKAREKMAAGEKVELISLTPEQRVLWRNKLKPVWDGFVEKHGQRGQAWVDTVKEISGITD
jgi:C4-dicarboxylate-binding protein DctP